MHTASSARAAAAQRVQAPPSQAQPRAGLSPDRIEAGLAPAGGQEPGLAFWLEVPGRVTVLSKCKNSMEKVQNETLTFQIDPEI